MEAVWVHLIISYHITLFAILTLEVTGKCCHLDAYGLSKEAGNILKKTVCKMEKYSLVLRKSDWNDSLNENDQTEGWSKEMLTWKAAGVGGLPKDF